VLNLAGECIPVRVTPRGQTTFSEEWEVTRAAHWIVGFTHVRAGSAAEHAPVRRLGDEEALGSGIHPGSRNGRLSTVALDHPLGPPPRRISAGGRYDPAMPDDEPRGRTVEVVLDSIPDAFVRAQESVEQARRRGYAARLAGVRAPSAFGRPLAGAQTAALEGA
jgi:hypothetical protein